ncbi:MAG: tRNA 2-thiouridine(34) synthase MnmA, partial [Patescibacteria group bacterium]
EAGADVVGVFIQGWYPPGMPCTWRSDRRDAMRVAARLNIPFHTLNAEKEYKESVIDYLLREYKAGRTPNPDIMCNREVKFGAFYRFAKEHGTDYIATGHYAMTEEGKLLRGVDEGKDQSYFLWAVPSDALAMTLFPLGEQKKDETRRLAKKFNLPNATKRDSQGICFLGSISVDDFLRAEFGTKAGVVVDEQGSEIGAHDGAVLHTIGERLSLADGPWYVTKKDMERNVLTVAHERLTPTQTGAIHLTDTNWLENTSPDEILTAQYRYHGPRIEGTLSADRTSFTPTTDVPEALASGQSLVIYSGELCIGGGIIQ